MRNALFLQRTNGRQGSKGRIAIVGTASTVELAIPDDGLPWAEVFFPTAKLWLFVVVAVQQDDIIGVARNIDEQYGCTSLNADDLDRHTFDRLLLAPGFY